MTDPKDMAPVIELAAMLGVPGATVKVVPYKGWGERRLRKGFVHATLRDATGRLADLQNELVPYTGLPNIILADCRPEDVVERLLRELRSVAREWADATREVAEQREQQAKIARAEADRLASIVAGLEES